MFSETFTRTRLITALSLMLCLILLVPAAEAGKKKKKKKKQQSSAPTTQVEQAPARAVGPSKAVGSYPTASTPCITGRALARGPLCMRLFEPSLSATPLANS